MFGPQPFALSFRWLQNQEFISLMYTKIHALFQQDTGATEGTS
jgi:hypothetical protein